MPRATVVAVRLPQPTSILTDSHWEPEHVRLLYREVQCVKLTTSLSGKDDIMTNAAASNRTAQPLPGFVTISEFRAHLAEMLGRVEQGEEVIIARGRQPVAKLVPLQGKRRRRLGVLREMVSERTLRRLTRAIEQPLSPLDQASLNGMDTDTLGIGRQ